VEVRLYDNSFVPSVLYISAGTVVRWTNRGRNHHTVTSDEGFWDSGELRPGEGYAVFFPLPGRYYYHCKLHARDMRAWVVVESGY
jgi:plastocyanin